MPPLWLQGRTHPAALGCSGRAWGQLSPTEGVRPFSRVGRGCGASGRRGLLFPTQCKDRHWLLPPRPWQQQGHESTAHNCANRTAKLSPQQPPPKDSPSPAQPPLGLWGRCRPPAPACSLLPRGAGGPKSHTRQDSTAESQLSPSQPPPSHPITLKKKKKVWFLQSQQPHLPQRHPSTYLALHP